MVMEVEVVQEEVEIFDETKNVYDDVLFDDSKIVNKNPIFVKKIHTGRGLLSARIIFGGDNARLGGEEGGLVGDGKGE